MRWRWSSICPLLLLLFKIAKSDDGEEGESGLEDGYSSNPADSTTINPTNASNEMGCEVSLFFYFINTGKSAAFGCIFPCACRARIRSSFPDPQTHSLESHLFWISKYKCKRHSTHTLLQKISEKPLLGSKGRMTLFGPGVNNGIS